MTDATREERERALMMLMHFEATEVRRAADHAINYRGADLAMTEDQVGRLEEARFLLRDCVPITRDELALLERGLWEMMLSAKYLSHKRAKGPSRDVVYFRSIGFCDDKYDYWTDKAHAFAKRMQEKEQEETK